ncbi:MAG: VIT1/CCC1 transporter family protein [Ignavibacteria bacterium]|nr:VIT1/CCC1 transporter family protein [Ignavibacteria bacterium]
MNQDDLQEPYKERGLLNTEDRVSEILYGLIMALTFTCTLSITKSDKTIVNDMLIGALGCNIAWGIVDAVMYLLTTLTDNVREATVFNFVQKTKDTEKARQFISDAIPSTIASVLQPDELEVIRKNSSKMPPAEIKRLDSKNFVTAVEIFVLVFLSTLPVALPFIFISDLNIALRTSNSIAILMMFSCGWILGKYAGRKRFLMGIMMSLIGAIFVVITIALGG